MLAQVNVVRLRVPCDSQRIYFVYRCTRCGNIWISKQDVSCPCCSKCKSRRKAEVLYMIVLEPEKV